MQIDFNPRVFAIIKYFLEECISVSSYGCFHCAGNSANDLVGIINKNRTAQKLPELGSSPGLGCIALQYAKECLENCSASNTVTCRPSEDDFTEIFAPNCGVELPTFGTISGRIVGCQKDYLDPSEAFSHVLVHDRGTLSLLRNRTHTEVGVGIIKAHKHKGPYFWCVLFSSGKRNSTFVLDDLGEGIEQKTGCYSGTNTPCSSAHKHGMHNTIWFTLLLHFTLLALVSPEITPRM